MRSRKMTLFVLIILITFLVCPPKARSAMPAYMDVVGENQGRIEGSCTLQGREGMIEVHSFGHNVSVPHNPSTGLPTGTRVHGPFEILKEVDKSSPLLYQALKNNERLASVTIKFYRIGPTDTQEHYYTVTLENAEIVKIAPSASSFPKETAGLKPMEIVSFVYNRIRWTWESGGIESEDDWREPKI